MSPHFARYWIEIIKLTSQISGNNSCKDASAKTSQLEAKRQIEIWQALSRYRSSATKSFQVGQQCSHVQQELRANGNKTTRCCSQNWNLKDKCKREVWQTPSWYHLSIIKPSQKSYHWVLMRHGALILSHRVREWLSSQSSRHLS